MDNTTNTIILIDNTFESKYSLEYKNIFDAKVKSLTAKLNLDSKNIQFDNNNISSLEYIEYIYKETENYENIIFIHSDMPLIDIEETEKLYNLHINNFAFYSYGENYPKGIVPSILRVGSFERIIPILKNKNITLSNSIIHESIFLEPNFFEIEILVSEYDLRYYRLDLTSINKSNNILISKLKDFNSYKEVSEAIISNNVSRVTLPAYIEIEICSTNNNKKRCIEAFYNKENIYVSKDDFSKIYDDISNFTDSCHLSIGKINEPLLNNDIFEILAKALSNKNITVYLETNAILLTKEYAQNIISLQHDHKNFNVIIHLDAIDKETYNKIYTNDHLDTILANLDYYLLRSSNQTYIQIIKQKDNFDRLKDFYAYFDKYKVKIVMQKYPTYRGIIENNKIGDLSPIVRLGCWHISRDMYIDEKYDSYICSYDIEKKMLLGNVAEKGLETVWNEAGKYYQQDTSKPMAFCENCDEWYLYNF